MNTWLSNGKKVDIADMESEHLKNAYFKLVNVLNRRLEDFTKNNRTGEAQVSEFNKLNGLFKQKSNLEKEVLRRIEEEQAMLKTDYSIFITRLMNLFSLEEIINIVNTHYKTELIVKPATKAKKTKLEKATL